MFRKDLEAMQKDHMQKGGTIKILILNPRSTHAQALP
jgi:hypothetical protein